jgi:membrane-associated phospholipid phosphatase
MPRVVAVCALLLVGVSSAEAQSFLSIFTELPSDARHLVTKDSAVVLGSAGALMVPLHPNDGVIARHTRSDGDGLAGWLVPGAYVGDAGWQSAGGLATYVVGRLRHSTRVGELGADLLRAQILNGAITDGLKVIVQRTRPDGDPYSFPSGHTSSAFATAAVLQKHLGWKVGVPAHVMALYVGSSRLAASRHFATDVLFGAALGITAGRAVTFKVHRQQLSVTPAISPGQVGVSASLH